LSPGEEHVHEEDNLALVGSQDSPAGDTSDGGKGFIPKLDAGHIVLLVPMIALAILMVVALFLPWSTTNSGSQSLADYAAPQPAVIAWSLLAIGMSGTIVALVILIMGTRRAVHAVAGGAFLYLLGSVIWYGSAILPNVVASGCNTNGGPLCNVPSGSPLLPGSSPASGFVLAVSSSLLVSVVALVSSRTLLRRDAPQPPE
jgi:uncharacterized membrane protein